MKKLIISTMMMVLALVSACDRFPFPGDDDPKPHKDCIDPKAICKECPCTMQYDPVCGCDKVTYSNACVAKNNGVTKYTKGPCEKPCIDPKQIDPSVGCTKEYNPVCGCDGITYGNPCMAKKAGVTSYTQGACVVILKDVITYSWTGKPEVDGCGSLLHKDNGELLIPEDESQIPDSIRYLVTVAPAKYTIEYQIIKYTDQFRCGMSSELKKAIIVRIKGIYPI